MIGKKPEQKMRNDMRLCERDTSKECKGKYKDCVDCVLDQIKAEIADLDDADYDYEGYYKAVTDALQIIDKYKTESEG